MAESEPEDMPSSSSMRPETEWSTREKLAIASYVLRSGEQHWSGAGRILKPLGEPGRPADWFTPKFCAQQYTALIGQNDAKKRKRGSERSDSSENIQPGVSPEEAIIARLTKERIEELKRQVRHERTDYRKLMREIEMIESGELDDQLDMLLKQIQNEGKEEEMVEETDAKTIEVVENSEQGNSPADSEKTDQIINTSEEAGEGEPDVHVEVQPEAKTEVSNEKEISPAAEISTIAEPMDVSSLPNEKTTVVSQENASEPLEPVLESTLDVNESEPPKDTSTEVDDEHQKEPDDEEKTEETKTVNTTSSDNATEILQPSKDEAAVEQEETMELKPVADEQEEVKVEDSVNAVKEEIKEKAKEEEVAMDTATEESETYSMSLEDDMKQSVSLPGTPAPSGNFIYDSFPSSPALSHSSDMDPDATASWKAWRKSIMILWKQVASHRYASLFLQPVTDDIAPNYSTTIYRSTDLATIKKNIESGIIRTTNEFCRDVMLMFQNAIMYNNSEHDVYKWTMEMQKDVIDQITQFRSTQMMVETTQPQENKSLRRSTIRRSAMSEKTGPTRTRRSAAADSDTKTIR